MSRRNYVLESTRRMRPEVGGIVGVSWSPSSELFAPLSVDVSVYTLSGDRLIYKKKPASPERYVSVALLDDGVVVGKKTPEVWDLETGKVRKKLKVNIGWDTGLSDSTLALSGDGSRLVGLSGYAYKFAIWDTNSWETVRKFYLEEKGRFISAAFSPDNSLMALGDTFGNVFFVATSGKGKTYGRVPLPGVQEIVDWGNWQNFRYGETHVGWKGDTVLALSRARVGSLAVPTLYVLDPKKERVVDVLNLFSLFKAYAVQEVLVMPTAEEGEPRNIALNLQEFQGGWAVSVGTTTLLFDGSLRLTNVIWDGPVSLSPDGRYYVPYGEDVRGIQIHDRLSGEAVLPYVPLGEVRSVAYREDRLVFTTSRGEAASTDYNGENTFYYENVPGRVMGVAPWREKGVLLLSSLSPEPDTLLLEGGMWKTAVIAVEDDEIREGYTLEDLPIVYPNGTSHPLFVDESTFRRTSVRLVTAPNVKAFAVLFLDRVHIYAYGRREALLRYEGVDSVGFWEDGFMLKRDEVIRFVKFTGEEYEIHPKGEGKVTVVGPHGDRYVIPTEEEYFPVHAPNFPKPILISDSHVVVGDRKFAYDTDVGIVFLLNRAIREEITVVPSYYDRKRETVLIPNANYVVVVPLDGSPPRVVKVDSKENAVDYEVGEVFCRKNTLYVLGFGEIRFGKKRGVKCT